MIRTQGKNIFVDFGDFGIITPITITNVLETDTIKFNIYNLEDEKIIDKTLPYVENKWEFQLTEEESAKLKKGDYWYEIMQYRNDVLQNTINKGSLFRVE